MFDTLILLNSTRPIFNFCIYIYIYIYELVFADPLRAVECVGVYSVPSLPEGIARAGLRAARAQNTLSLTKLRHSLVAGPLEYFYIKKV